MKKIFVVFAVIFSAAVFGALPPDSIVIEAETLNSDGKSWIKRPHFTGWYGGQPSGGYHLAGYSKFQLPATGKFKVDKPGKYHFWVRYLDLVRYHQNNGFVITLKQNGKIIGSKIFSSDSLRKTPEGIKKWGRGFARFVWDKMEFNAAQSGEVTIELAKQTRKGTTGSGGRHLDMFIITTDTLYEPLLSDLFALYVRVRMLKEQTEPVAIHIFGRHQKKLRNNWYIPHMNINKKGLFKGANNGAGNMREFHMKSGDVSPWIELSSYLSTGSSDFIKFSAITSYYNPVPENAAFELQFSRTPSEKDILKTCRRSGSGNALQLVVDAACSTISTDLENSRISRKYAANAGKAFGKAPELFPFATGCAIDPLTSREAVDNEVNALKSIGINTSKHLIKEKRFKYIAARAGFFHLRNDKCMQKPRLKVIDQRMKTQTDMLKQANPAHFVLMMDEPGLEFDHILSCQYCKESFAVYLKKKGINLSGSPTRDKKDALRYLWSCRYYQHIMTEFLRVGSDSFRKYMNTVPTAVNFSNELMGGSMISRGCNWFDLCNTGALTGAWGEDWANTTRTYQSNGYNFAMFRAACRKRQLKFGIHSVLVERVPWVIQSKAFLAIGHGAKMIEFFNYGPWYTITSDSQSHRPEIYRAIKQVTFASGAVEKTLINASPVRGDIAQLWSEASDIWNMFEDNPFGKERVYLNLLLRHCQYQPQILSAADLEDQLKYFSVLVVSDSHLERRYVPVVAEWVKNGGTLYLTAGALQFDELNRPLGLRQILKLSAEPLKIIQKSGRASFEMPRHKIIDKYKNIPVTVGTQFPFDQSVKYGKGSVISAGFFPGLSYIGRAVPAKGAPKSIMSFPSAHREYIKALKLPVVPRIAAADPMIEANLLTGKEADLIVLSNWRGKTVRTTVTLNNVSRHSRINTSNVKLLKHQYRNGNLVLTVQIPAGGYIELFK